MTTVEAFSRVFIRLAGRDRFSFTTLSVLDTLNVSDRPMRPSELSKTEQISQPGITQMVSRLEAEGLLQRHPDPTDRRAALISLIDAGRAITTTRHNDRCRQPDPVIDELNSAQQRAIKEALPALQVLAHLGRSALDQVNDAGHADPRPQ